MIDTSKYIDKINSKNNNEKNNYSGYKVFCMGY